MTTLNNITYHHNVPSSPPRPHHSPSTKVMTMRPAHKKAITNLMTRKNVYVLTKLAQIPAAVAATAQYSVIVRRPNLVRGGRQRRLG